MTPAEKKDEPAPRKRAAKQVGPPTADGTLSYLVPITPSIHVTLEGPFPLTEDHWRQFMAVLNAMKPGMVGQSPAPAQEAAGGR